MKAQLIQTFDDTRIAVVSGTLRFLKGAIEGSIIEIETVSQDVHASGQIVCRRGCGTDFDPVQQFGCVRNLNPTGLTHALDGVVVRNGDRPEAAPACDF